MQNKNTLLLRQSMGAIAMTDATTEKQGNKMKKKPNSVNELNFSNCTMTLTSMSAESQAVLCQLGKATEENAKAIQEICKLVSSNKPLISVG